MGCVAWTSTPVLPRYCHSVLAGSVTITWLELVSADESDPFSLRWRGGSHVGAWDLRAVGSRRISATQRLARRTRVTWMHIYNPLVADGVGPVLTNIGGMDGPLKTVKKSTVIAPGSQTSQHLAAVYLPRHGYIRSESLLTQ